MSDTQVQAVSSKPVKISRTKAIEMLEELRFKAGETSSGIGRMFSATWVTVGDKKKGPVLCSKVVRFQVNQHLRGGGLSWNPEKQGYMVVFEMINRKRALKLYKEEATRELEDAQCKLASARQELSEKKSNLAILNGAASDAVLAVSLAEGGTYQTAKARNADEDAARKRLQQAQRQVDDAEKSAQRSLMQMLYKVDDPEGALRQAISDRIERLRVKLTAEKDESERQVLEKKLTADRALLDDPVKSLLSRYRMLNLNGLTRLKINRQTFEISTPPVPALPN